METKKLEVGDRITLGDTCIIPVTEFILSYGTGAKHLAAFGLKRPVAVLVVTSSGPRAFRISGQAVPLEELIKELPEIRETLAAI
jgi:uncharacterized spore protein YtfJ